MAFIIGILKPRNHRPGSADQLGKLSLGQLGLLPKLVYLPGDLAMTKLGGHRRPDLGSVLFADAAPAHLPERNRRSQEATSLISRKQP